MALRQVACNREVLASAQCSFFASSSSALSASRVSFPARSAAPSALRISCGRRDDALKEFRGMSREAIEDTVIDLKGELFLLRAKQAVKAEYKPSEFRRIRKKVAQLLTVRREIELTDGVGKRDSRKLDRAWKKSIEPRAPPSYNPDDWKK